MNPASKLVHMCMHVCVCAIYIYTYIYMQLAIYTHMYVYYMLYIHIYVCVYMYIYNYIYIYYIKSINPRLHNPELCNPCYAVTADLMHNPDKSQLLTTICCG